MILIQIILFVSFIFLLVIFLANRNTAKIKAWKKLVLIAFIVLALIVILNPGLSDQLAHRLGVGRGADLLLYCLAMAFVFQVLNNYIKSKDEQRRMAFVVRELAIIKANNDKHNQKITK